MTQFSRNLPPNLSKEEVLTQFQQFIVSVNLKIKDLVEKLVHAKLSDPTDLLVNEGDISDEEKPDQQTVSDETLDDIEKKKRDRENNLNEIFETEKVYIETLRNILTYWKEPMSVLSKAPNPIINKDQVQTIFYAISDILNVAEELVIRLEERLKQPPKNIGDVFLDFIPIMKIYYSQFVVNFDNCMETYLELIKNPEFSSFQKLCMTNANAKLDLTSLIITPVQRIPRYELLIKDLIKRTEKDHPDHNNLLDAHKEIRELNLYINEKKKEDENRKKILALQKEIQSTAPITLLKENRLLISQGEVTIEIKKKEKTFNGVLIY